MFSDFCTVLVAKPHRISCFDAYARKLCEVDTLRDRVERGLWNLFRGTKGFPPLIECAANPNVTSRGVLSSVMLPAASANDQIGIRIGDSGMANVLFRSPFPLLLDFGESREIDDRLVRPFHMVHREQSVVHERELRQVILPKCFLQEQVPSIGVVLQNALDAMHTPLPVSARGGAIRVQLFCYRVDSFAGKVFPKHSTHNLRLLRYLGAFSMALPQERQNACVLTISTSLSDTLCLRQYALTVLTPMPVSADIFL